MAQTIDITTLQQRYKARAEVAARTPARLVELAEQGCMELGTDRCREAFTAAGINARMVERAIADKRRERAEEGSFP